MSAREKRKRTRKGILGEKLCSGLDDYDGLLCLVIFFIGVVGNLEGDSILVRWCTMFYCIYQAVTVYSV